MKIVPNSLTTTVCENPESTCISVTMSISKLQITAIVDTVYQV